MIPVVVVFDKIRTDKSKAEDSLSDNQNFSPLNIKFINNNTTKLLLPQPS